MTYTLFFTGQCCLIFMICLTIITIYCFSYTSSYSHTNTWPSICVSSILSNIYSIINQISQSVTQDTSYSACTKLNFMFYFFQGKLLILLNQLCKWLELPYNYVNHQVRNLEIDNNCTPYLIISSICTTEILSVLHKKAFLNPHAISITYL